MGGLFLKEHAKSVGPSICDVNKRREGEKRGEHVAGELRLCLVCDDVFSQSVMSFFSRDIRGCAMA